jgi:hypothetical protein
MAMAIHGPTNARNIAPSRSTRGTPLLRERERVQAPKPIMNTRNAAP